MDTPQTARQALSPRQRIHQDFRNFLFRLTKEPPDLIREVAERQINQTEKAFKDAPFFSRSFQVDYAGVRDRLDGARENLRAGDALKDKTDEPSQLERRRSYTRAYTIAFTEGENLAALIGQADFLVLVTGNVVVPAVTAAGQAVANAGGALAKGIGGTAKTVLYVAAAGVPLSLLTYAAIRAYRKKANQP
jgi:hypothetical protein